MGIYIACAIILITLVAGLAYTITENKKMAARLEQAIYSQSSGSDVIIARQDMLIRTLEASLEKQHRLLSDMSLQTEQKLEQMRRLMYESINRLTEENSRQLDSMRKTVDEKLQESLDKKLNESFRLVSERLEQVYKGLGEMQAIASSVGDLKKVLSNVKTRGILGEIQLGAILEQLLSPEQYGVNVKTRPDSRDNVEFAVKLPGADGEHVWLPIDAKFPQDAYQALLDAYDTGNQQNVEAALKQLCDRVSRFAKEMKEKYVAPPFTTDFSIMFLPVEGLYAELVRAGMIETLQRNYNVVITGPTTMGALLNSLQMGFKTLAIQKRSGEVWKILGTVKTEFQSFSTVLESAQRHITQVGTDLDKLIGVRTRKIQKTLEGVETLPLEGQAVEPAPLNPQPLDASIPSLIE